MKSTGWDATQHKLSIFQHDLLLRYQKLKLNTLSVGSYKRVLTESQSNSSALATPILCISESFQQ